MPRPVGRPPKARTEVEEKVETPKIDRDAEERAQQEAAAAVASILSTGKFPESMTRRASAPKKSLREEMLAVLASGRTVQHGRMTITDPSQIPPDIELTKGDIEAQKNLLSSLLSKKDALEAEIEDLRKSIESMESVASE